nr:hypothetical protein [Kingella potus]
MMPEPDSPQSFADLLSPPTVYVAPADEHGGIGIGVAFHCEWDLERSLGVILCGGEVVETGGEDVTFCFSDGLKCPRSAFFGTIHRKPYPAIQAYRKGLNWPILR